LLHEAEPQEPLNFDDGSAGEIIFEAAEPSVAIKPLVSFSDECLHQRSSRHMTGSFDCPRSSFDARDVGRGDDDDASDVRLHGDEERGEIVSHGFTRNASEFAASSSRIRSSENMSNLAPQQEDKISRFSPLLQFFLNCNQKVNDC
jgi:hypothetical protein